MTSARRPRVCLATTSHPVSYSRFLDREAASLARAGYEVMLMGVGGEARPGSGVETVSYSGGTGLAKPVLLAKLGRAIRQGGFDVLQCLDPWTLLLGLQLKGARPRLKLVYESSEWFPRMFLDRSEMPAPARHALSLWVTLLERDACRRADAILETNATRAERFRQQGRCPVLVPNYPPLELLPEPAEEREPCIVYTGLVSPHRGFEKLLEALALVKVEHPSVRLRVIGGFETRDGYEERVSDMVSRRELVASVEFTGPLPYQEMFGRLRSCLAGVVLLQPGRGNDYTGLPNKLFEFMGSGLAVVASDFPELARVVRDTGCGWLVDPTRPEKVAQALNRVLAEPAESKRRGRLGREAVRSRFHWGMAEAALLKVYQEMLSS